VAGKGQIVELEVPVINGIQIPRHPLDAAAKELLSTAWRLMRYLRDHVPQTKEEAVCLTAQAKICESASRAILGLMAEHRANARMAREMPPLSDDEYREAVRQELTDDDVIALYNERFQDAQ